MAGYIEPSDYIPKEIRKKYKLGEYNEEVNKELEELLKEEKEKEKDSEEDDEK